MSHQLVTATSDVGKQLCLTMRAISLKTRLDLHERRADLNLATALYRMGNENCFLSLSPLAAYRPRRTPRTVLECCSTTVIGSRTIQTTTCVSEGSLIY
jgi:hypothetical protein